jgi:hypothetical protein
MDDIAMAPLAPRLVCMLILLALIALVQGNFFIDDSDLTIIQYSSNPGSGPVWGPFSGRGLGITFPNGSLTSVDATPCYGGTL